MHRTEIVETPVVAPAPKTDADVKVALFIDTAFPGSRAECRGILDYAREHGGWHIMIQEARAREQLLDLARLGVNGVIVESPLPADATASAALHVPVVLLDVPSPVPFPPDYPLADAPCVRMDSRAVGVLAARYFLEHGYTHFAYVDEVNGRYWSAERRSGFEETVHAAGHECGYYGGRFSNRERRSWAVESPRMIRFLLGLQRPTAVLAAMDSRARLVLEACSAAGLRVPEDIAVLGADDDLLLCEAATPPLSSIRTGRYRHGHIAAQMLDELLQGKKPKTKNVSLPPQGVTTRSSTGYDAGRDPALARALAFIHERAADSPVPVSEVVRAAGCSRRHLETHFRKRLGTTIRKLVERTRLERVKDMLERSALPVGEIALRCGFPGNSDLSILFRRATGMTMREWRLRHHEASGE